MLKDIFKMDLKVTHLPQTWQPFIGDAFGVFRMIFLRAPDRYTLAGLIISWCG